MTTTLGGTAAAAAARESMRLQGTTTSRCRAAGAAAKTVSGAGCCCYQIVRGMHPCCLSSHLPSPTDLTGPRKLLRQLAALHRTLIFARASLQKHQFRMDSLVRRWSVGGEEKEVGAFRCTASPSLLPSRLSLAVLS